MDTSRYLKTSLINLFFLFALLNSAAFAKPPIATQLQNILAKALANSLTPGAVLLVSSPQIGTITVTVGLADKKNHQLMQGTNNFRIASMSKTFLATTILKLVEENKLTLDAKIAHLLPDSIDINRLPNGKKVTVRQLLQMRSGIPDYVDYDAYSKLVGQMVGKKWTPQLCIEIVYNEKPHFAPDSSYEYSNTNYLLLQLIVEKLTGHSYAASIRQKILDPLHLKNTFIEIAESNVTNQLRTHGYQLEDQHLTDVTTLNDGLGMGDSGMISTVNDLNQFIQALLKEKIILSPTSLKEMLHMKDDYGLGIYGEEISGEWAQTHNGMSSGFQGQYYYFPKEQLTIILLTNYFDTDLIEKVIPKVFKSLTKGNQRTT
ncbi:serine hydrolase domain-containing protein [Legionella brunensis]|uniref:Serine-type D-Ala-D-Ala carboxypeptidase n=1 Tax=Legionella brunensis TaxID=29422 RepID=A0A0W0SM66_9GAMM|nr:serine hydrolase domain-containing protein [Legionella brunensis]KTC84498.1 serine-type D-Ala-D-Ala carboxypeptidase [Legionella brunensis]